VTGRRAERMANTVRSIVSEVIRNKLNDPRISPLSSVTRVEMSGDLTIAKVFISVYGEDAEGRRTLTALRHAKGHVQRFVARHLRVRYCPEVRFEMDDALKRATDTVRIIEQTGCRHEASSSEVPEGHSAEPRQDEALG